MCIAYVESLKFEGGAMVDMVPMVLSSQEVYVFCCATSPAGTSSSLAVEGEAAQIGF